MEEEQEFGLEMVTLLKEEAEVYRQVAFGHTATMHIQLMLHFADTNSLVSEEKLTK